MLITRAWSMPTRFTFTVPQIQEFIRENIPQNSRVIDPFANAAPLAECFKEYISNDLDPSMPTDYHLDAFDFLSDMESESADAILYDPPYSPRQVSEVYKELGHSVNMATTQASYWAKQKQEIARILKPGGTVITFGWNSGGVGMNYGMTIRKILIVAHGGWHNDTICTLETKSAYTQDSLI